MKFIVERDDLNCCSNFCLTLAWNDFNSLFNTGIYQMISRMNQIYDMSISSELKCLALIAEELEKLEEEKNEDSSSITN